MDFNMEPQWPALMFEALDVGVVEMDYGDESGSSSDNNLPLHSHLMPPLYSTPLPMMLANQAAAASSPASYHSSAPSPAPPASPATTDFRRQSRRECAPPFAFPRPCTRGSPRLSSPKTPWLHARALQIVAADDLSFQEPPTDSLTDLVPNPTVPVQDTATTSSPVSNSTGPPQSGGGPLSRTHVVPPRPKPGRKPATEEPESKRKAQNRASQRNFRQRKQRTVMELQTSLNLTKEQLKETSAELARVSTEYKKQVECFNMRLEDLERTNNALRAELEQCRAGGFHRHGPLGSIIGQPQSISVYDPRHDIPFRRAFDTDFDAQALVPSPQPTDSGCDRCTKDHCACLAEMTNDVTFHDHGDAMTGIVRDGQEESNQEKPRDHSEFETDFTSAFRKPKPHEANPAELLSSAEDTKFPDCGFCTGQPESCICRSMRSEAADATSSLARVATASSAEDVKPNVAMSGPGSCADCQANPEQRAWCQRVAQLRSEATPPNSRRNSSKSVTLGTMEPKASTSIEMSSPAPSPAGRGETVGCSDAFKLLVGRVDTEMDWRQLKPVPPTFAQEDARRNTFTMEPGRYSAMELDASSILTTLQHASGPIKPRPSDGTYARLVQEAEERRRKSSTPMKKTVDHPMLDSEKN